MSTIKEFVETYNNFATESLKDDYLRNNLEIKSYLPFLQKDAIVTVVAERSTFKHELYKKENGTTGVRKTDIFKVNSTTQYLLFCRVIIENYTNLEVETPEFYTEYDLLKQSGLLDKLMVGNEHVAPLIPANEIAEMRQLLSWKQSDLLTNFSDPYTFIQGEVERFGTLAGITLKPVMDKIAKSLNEMDENEIKKLGNKIDKLIKKLK